MTQTYFQKGLGLKAEVRPMLASSYRSAVVEALKAGGYEASAGGIRLKLAREFGFCYGVDRAVEYAYEARHRFPDRPIFLSGEIIHNPDVNARLRAMGICILPEARDAAARFAAVRHDAVVILPAFGVTVNEMEHLSQKGCVLVDTTCGSVLNVWKKVTRCAREGFTVIIHGKHYHEETRATASQALKYHGHYLCARDAGEAAVLCAYLRGQVAAGDLMERFADAMSPGFDPSCHLRRIGIANQTTMLMSETLEIQEMLRTAMREVAGDDPIDDRFRAFDTICSATQDRQDALAAMLEAGDLDVMIVIGGYNSSNTQALARMCAARVPTFHVDSPGCIEASAIRHRTLRPEDARAQAWLGSGPVTVGITAGASTPDSVVGDVVERILAQRGCSAADLVAAGECECVSSR